MLKRLSLYTLLLCLVPFFTWIFAWQWQGDNSISSIDYFLYLITQTGTVPYAIISCAVFTLLFYPIFPTREKWIAGVLVMVLSMAVTQGIKSGAKKIFAEPRPFVTELAKQSDISTDYFYDQSKTTRENIVAEYYANQSETPVWLAHHREKEVGYSFPSGHSIFAASWLLLAVGFTQLFGRCTTKAKILVAGVTIWGWLMLISRLRLGMHYPIDLFISILLAWILHCALFVYIEKKQIFAKKLLQTQ